MEAALAHRNPDAVEAVYYRSDLLDRRHELMRSLCLSVTLSRPGNDDKIVWRLYCRIIGALRPNSSCSRIHADSFAKGRPSFAKRSTAILPIVNLLQRGQLKLVRLPWSLRPTTTA